MRKKIEWEWEKLDEGTHRCKVIGGWLVLHVKTFMVRSKEKTEIISQSESMVFLEDRDHEWVIVPPFKNEVTAPKGGNVNADDFKPKAKA